MNEKIKIRDCYRKGFGLGKSRRRGSGRENTAKKNHLFSLKRMAMEAKKRLSAGVGILKGGCQGKGVTEKRKYCSRVFFVESFERRS